MQLTAGYVRAVSDSINFITANLTVKRSLRIRLAKNEASYRLTVGQAMLKMTTD